MSTTCSIDHVVANQIERRARRILGLGVGGSYPEHVARQQDEARRSVAGLMGSWLDGLWIKSSDGWPAIVGPVTVAPGCRDDPWVTPMSRKAYGLAMAKHVSSDVRLGRAAQRTGFSSLGLADLMTAESSG